MNIEPDNSELIRRYLLGTATEAESASIEERFMSDDPAFESVNAVEDELFYEYSAGEMSAEERSVFERRFLSDRAGRDRLAFARALLERTGEIGLEATPEPASGFVDSLIGFFASRRALQLGAAAAMVLVAIGVVGLLIRNAQVNSDIARQKADAERIEQEQQLAEKQREQDLIEKQIQEEKNKQTPDQKRTQELQKQSQRLGNEIEKQQQRLQKPTQRSVPGGPQTIATAVLSPGLFTRNGGQGMNQIKLDPGSRSVVIVLELKNVEEHARYSTEMRSVDDSKVIAMVTGLKPAGSGVKTVRFTVPANKLRRADYEINLKGQNAHGQPEFLTRYYFSVDK